MSKSILIVILIAVLAASGCTESTTGFQSQIDDTRNKNFELSNRISTVEAKLTPLPAATPFPTSEPPEFVVVVKGSTAYDHYYVEYITSFNFRNLEFGDPVQTFRWEGNGTTEPECFANAKIGESLPPACGQ